MKEEEYEREGATSCNEAEAHSEAVVVSEETFAHCFTSSPTESLKFSDVRAFCGEGKI